jgi:hypothetical protein
MGIASYAFLVAERVVGVIHRLHLAPTFPSQSIVKVSEAVLKPIMPVDSIADESC